MKDLLKDITLPFALISLALGLGLLFIAQRQVSNAKELMGHKRDAVAKSASFDNTGAISTGISLGLN